MKPLLVFSHEDMASTNVLQHFDVGKPANAFPQADQLFENKDFWSHVIDSSMLNYSLPQDLTPSFIIFVSRHSSKAGKPGFHCHVTGNWTTDTTAGGSPETLAVASPTLLKAALLELSAAKEQYQLTEFALSLEVTHHGPTDINVPSVFMELGSEQNAWNDKHAGSALASAVKKVVFEFRLPEKEVRRIGFGGNHYAAKFTRQIWNDGPYVGHIVPKHTLPLTTDEMLLRASASVRGEGLEWWIDKKGTNSELRHRIIALAESHGIQCDYV